MSSLHIATRGEPTQQQRPSTAKNKHRKSSFLKREIEEGGMIMGTRGRNRDGMRFLGHKSRSAESR